MMRSLTTMKVSSAVALLGSAAAMSPASRFSSQMTRSSLISPSRFGSSFASSRSGHLLKSTVEKTIDTTETKEEEETSNDDFELPDPAVIMEATFGNLEVTVESLAAVVDEAVFLKAESVDLGISKQREEAGLTEDLVGNHGDNAEDTSLERAYKAPS
eukprot:CAMPEP_0172568584 /NCGR_PEP_ID=MMETSP1067-20121228/120474_1 /TAXON_ID=265564 ORGANISM="Thalassiosira punctigera, Strain Tpunct2005C2" /NCGR_SAMPLE_ID=MMETSP1067 /ASSEMBLY_ACC=CAM_ASM_000444 /LENGTH=157 /DNA_ID=CAMNT_0013360225 /DNA_START=77 /DNA_END=546 /DNA_ORIENTATION=-